MLEKRTIENAQINMGYLLSIVDQQLLLGEDLSDWVYINRDIDKMLVRDYNNQDYNFNLDISNVLQVINNRISSSTIGKYVTSFIINGNNGVRITVGTETDYLDLEKMYQEPWFMDNYQSHVLSWSGIETNLSMMRASDYFIPLARTIIFADSRKSIGWQMIAFTPALVSDSIKGFDLTEGDLLFLLDGSDRCVYSNDPTYLAENMMDFSLFQKLSEDRGHIISTFDGHKTLAVYEKSDYSGFQIVQLVNYRYVSQQKAAATRISLIIVLITMVISLLITIFLSFKMTKPLSRLLNQMNLIAKGNFKPSLQLEGDDEFGILGKGMNRLSTDIEQLLSKIKQEEKEKSELEYKVLQNQINPHFIYNVLNSIKVMAMIQKSDGIYETVTALGALLKETSKGSRDIITIKEELFLLDKYIDIQKIRKKGMIQVNYLIEEGIESCQIPRFTLQPIVENAVFHGFEGKKGIGIIDISVRSDHNNVLLEIKDNGLGIPEDQVEHILEKWDTKDSMYNQVGLKNINDRIKLIFGKEYGLSISSKHLHYTLVSIRIPKKSEAGS